MDMETQATISRLDLLCETFGISLKTLAERARVAPEDLYMARDDRWHPITALRLWEHLGVPLSFFDIPTAHLAELLKAFSVVDPSHRFTLIDKIWNIETVWSAVQEYCPLPWPSSLRLSDLLEAYSDHPVKGPGSFVAFVRRELERSRVLVFSHPFGNDDYTAILFVLGERSFPFKYLVVNEDKSLLPLTNALFQWYEVLRLLSRWDNTDDDDGFTIDPNASWTAVYLERTVDGYCPRLNEQLHKRFTLHDFTFIFIGDTGSDTMTPTQCRWYSIFHALMEGLPPAVIAEYGSRRIESGIESDDEEIDDEDEIVRQIVSSLNQPRAVDAIVKQVVGQRVVPTEYDWVIPSYPSFIKRLVMEPVAQRRIPRHIMQSVLSIPDYEYSILLENVELLGTRDMSTES